MIHYFFSSFQLINEKYFQDYNLDLNHLNMNQYSNKGLNPSIENHDVQSESQNPLNPFDKNHDVQNESQNSLNSLDKNHDIPKNYEYHKVNETHPCNVTVVIFDPRLTIKGYFKSKRSLFTAIESVAKNLNPKESVCFSIQTSACIITDDNDSVNNSPEAKAYNAILSNTKPNEYPNFYEYLVNSGRVRVSILDYAKYKLKSCSNFISPNYAWMNVHYWEDEFVNGVDSDLLFFVQDDSVLCEPIDITRWSDIAMVGAPWPNVHGSVPKPSMCSFLETKFYSWMKENVLTEEQQKIEFCPKEKGIHGNGGLSMRSRSWIQKAIRACPHLQYSGLSAEEIANADCSLNEGVPEDVYYAAILRYLNAPLPTAFEASLFSSEMIVPYQVAYEWWGPKDDKTEMKRLAKKRLTDDHYIKFERYIDNDKLHASEQGKMYFIPIGFHNTWFYHSRSFLEYITQQCPAFNVIRYQY